MLLTILLFAASNAVTIHAGPQPGETAIYKDWVTGCDNERNCAAVALEAPTTGTDGDTDHLEVMIEKRLPGHQPPVVQFRFPAMPKQAANLRIFVDQIAVPLPPAEAGTVRIGGAQARQLVQVMRKGHRVYLRDAEGQMVARTSLTGLTAALLRIDGQQGRQGTAEALARRGNRVPYDDLPGSRVSLTRPARSDLPPAVPDAGQMALLRSSDTCSAAAEPSPAPPMVRLDADNSMMIMPWQCGNGAYNLYSNIMIVKNYGEISSASFDYDNGITGDGPSNVLVNVSWDDEKRVLESVARHRGIGDCGRVDRYIWDGEKFMLSEQLVMPECRMAFDRIRTWKVDVADR